MFRNNIYKLSQLRGKLRIIRELLSQNGIRWVFYYFLLSLLRRSSRALGERVLDLEIRNDLPGCYSCEWNRAVWRNYNWAQKGEEWTQSLEWKQSVIDLVLLKYVEAGKTVLEIGPGAGRWTETLQKMARRLTLVDISDRCIELCKNRFSTCNNIEFFVNEGTNLDFIEDATVDFIWSWDVFVHLSPQCTKEYISEFSRVLKKRGRGIIHHPKDAGLHGGWRSRMTAELFSHLLEKYELIPILQFDSWDSGGRFGVREFHDTITVFEK